MPDELPPNERCIVPSKESQRQTAFNAGVATGCIGCVGAILLAGLGFVCGYSLVGIAHDYEWFYTHEEFRHRYGDSGAGLQAFSNAANGGLVGAILFPVAGAALFAWIRSRKKR